jgi:hypothetical protein
MLIPFIGLHLLTNCNKKWTAIVYNMAAWPFLYFVLSKAGLTISTFLFLILIIVLDLALIFFKRNLVSVGSRGIYHTIGACLVAFLATVLFNPFHLTNLTHTFVISVSRHAERWRNIHEWWPAFDWSNPVGTAKPFLVMYIIAWAALAFWILILVLSYRSVNRYKKRKAKSSDEYRWPKIDLSLMLIAALTIYMTIRSRRFIPIAAIAACPIIALLIDQIIRAVSATRNFHKRNRLSVSPMPKVLQRICTGLGFSAVLVFGIWWGGKFKLIYLDPWPADPKLNSVFLRMTASDAKPFYALKFIKDNKLEGKMFNYWTEGGFIAWGQEPDPNTGRTPLQLFMDGRAQAAYDRRAFDIWSHVMAGGPFGSVGQQVIQAAAARAKLARRRVEEILTVADYVKIGQSIGQALKEHKVWVVLMPFGQFDSIFVKGLQRNGNWIVVFLNNKQRLLVDITTPRGRELYDGIFDGTTLYPDDYHRNLIRAHSWLLYRRGIAEKTKGLEFAIEAFKSSPSPAPMLEIILVAASFAELRPDVNKFCEDYINEFAKNGDSWAKQDGYRHRVEAARLAAYHLENVARAQKDIKLAQFYADVRGRCVNERVMLAKERRW